MPKFTSFAVSLKLPWIGEIEGTWEPDESERKAAWEMYVELVTRISIVELRPEEGLLREALASLYSLFDSTRRILRQYGPGIAQPKGEGTMSFGYLAVAILNGVLRPMLAKWHPLLQDYEATRPGTLSALKHEQNWEYSAELRQELNMARVKLIEYADLLAQVAEVPTLIIEQNTP